MSKSKAKEKVIQAYYHETDVEEDFQSDSECEHESSVNVDGCRVCSLCGYKMEEELVENEVRYYSGGNGKWNNKNPSRHNQIAPEERSLYYDMNQYGFPQEIIERANNYYVEIIKNRIYRAGKRLSIVFACTYHAHIDIGEPRKPEDLARVFNLDRKEISNGLKTFSRIFRKRPDKVYITAMDFVPKIFADLNIDPDNRNLHLRNIQKIHDYVKKTNRIFNSSNPQSVAAGLVYFYLVLWEKKNHNRKMLNKGEFSKIVNLTDITFTKLATEAYNCVKPGVVLKF